MSWSPASIPDQTDQVAVVTGMTFDVDTLTKSRA